MVDREYGLSPVVLLGNARESTKRRCNNIFNRYKNKTNKRNKQNEKFTTKTDLKPLSAVGG